MGRRVRRGIELPAAMSRRAKRKRDHDAEEETTLEDGLEFLCLEGTERASEHSCRRNQRGTKDNGMNVERVTARPAVAHSRSDAARSF